MADYDLTKFPYNKGFMTNNIKQYMGQMVTDIWYIDCATSGALPTTGLSSGKTYKIGKLPANCFVRCTSLIVDVGEGAGDTITLTDGTNTLLNAASVQTADTVVSTVSTSGFTLGTAADLYFTPSANITVAKFWIVMEWIALKSDM